MILNTYIAGDGEPIVLIHSGGMTGITEYEEQNEYFSSQNYKVIRPDLRGHGKSEGDIHDFFSHCAPDLKDTLDSLNIEKCHIAGVSVGGIAALLFAKEFPSRVKTLSFSGIFPTKTENWDELTKMEAEHHTKLMENEEIVAALDEMHGNNDWRALLRSYNTDDFYPFHETGDVNKVEVPTLCVVGSDAELEVSAAITYKQMNPNFNISMIPFAGHLVHNDQPDLYTRTLETFIKSHSTKE